MNHIKKLPFKEENERKKVQVISSGPKLDRLKILPPDPQYRKGRKYLVGYVGVIGEQEGIDLLLESVKYILESERIYSLPLLGEEVTWNG